jgi:hypothetical protein
MTSYAVEDVFREANPTHTLIDRSSAPEYARIENELRKGGRVVRLHGPSKIGKTLLCVQVLKDKDPIVIYGDDIKAKDQFWSLVAERVGVETKNVTGYCAERGRPIVIEDFHWVSKNVQSALIRSFKPLLDAGGTAILISVPDVAQQFLDTARSGTKADEILGDLLAKTVSVPAPRWKKHEIREIAVRGFKTLNLDLPEWVLPILTRFAFSNPLLMQKHCAELCFKLEIKHSYETPTKRTPTRDHLESAFKHVARENARLFGGIVGGAGLAQYDLKSGNRVDLVTLLLYSIAGLPIATKLGMPTLQRRVRANLQLHSGVPAIPVMKDALQGLITDMRKAGQSGLVLDENDFLYLAHPFFKAYLIWILVETCGGALPDLDEYIDPDDTVDAGETGDQSASMLSRVLSFAKRAFRMRSKVDATGV